MYLTRGEAKVATGLKGMGFDFSTITNALSPVTSIVTSVLSKKQQAQAAEAQAKIAEANKKAAEAQAKVVALGPGGATASTKPATIWQNKWTWVALGSGALLAGLAVWTITRKRS